MKILKDLFLPLIHTFELFKKMHFERVARGGGIPNMRRDAKISAIKTRTIENMKLYCLFIIVIF